MCVCVGVGVPVCVCYTATCTACRMFGKNSRQQPAASATLSKAQLLPLPCVPTAPHYIPMPSGFLFFCLICCHTRRGGEGAGRAAAFAVGEFRCCSGKFLARFKLKMKLLLRSSFPRFPSSTPNSPLHPHSPQHVPMIFNAI